MTIKYKNQETKIVTNRVCVELICDYCGRKAEYPERKLWEWGGAGTASGLLKRSYEMYGERREEEMQLCYDCAEKLMEIAKQGNPINRRPSKMDIEEKLIEFMTVGDLCRELEQLDDDDIVLIASNYGDRQNTQQVSGICCVNSNDSNKVQKSGYSDSGLALTYDGNDRDWEPTDNPLNIVVLS